MRRPPPRSTLFPYTPLFRILKKVAALAEAAGIAYAPHDGSVGPIVELDRKSTRLNSSHEWIFCMPPFFFNETATTEIYPLPLHAALPNLEEGRGARRGGWHRLRAARRLGRPDRRTRSEEHTSELQSRVDILYAAFFF